MIFLPFHASVLEPDFDLSLGEAEGVGDFDPTSSRQIPVEVEFLLQFQHLMPRVGSSGSFRFAREVRSVRCRRVGEKRRGEVGERRDSWRRGKAERKRRGRKLLVN